MQLLINILLSILIISVLIFNTLITNEVILVKNNYDPYTTSNGPSNHLLNNYNNVNNDLNNNNNNNNNNKINISSNTNNYPLVSVVIPSYNRWKALVWAVNLCLQQTYKGDVEVIIIDDGSSQKEYKDKNVHTKEFKSNDKSRRVHLINRKNSGRSAARNYGVGIAKGKYIAFLDDDDLSMPHRFEAQVEALEKDTEAVGSCSEGLAMNDRKFKLDKMKTNKLLSKFVLYHREYFRHVVFKRVGLSQQGMFPNKWDYAFLLKHNLVIASSVMLRRHVAKKHKFNIKLSFAEDYTLWKQILKDNTHFVYVDQPLVLYDMNHGKF